MWKAPVGKTFLIYSEERKMTEKFKSKDFNGRKLALVLLALLLSVIF